MSNDEKRIWGIHTQDDNLFLKNNVIAIGWSDMGNLNNIDANRDAFVTKFRLEIILYSLQKVIVK